MRGWVGGGRGGRKPPGQKAQATHCRKRRIHREEGVGGEGGETRTARWPECIGGVGRRSERRWLCSSSTGSSSRTSRPSSGRTRRSTSTAATSRMRSCRRTGLSRCRVRRSCCCRLAAHMASSLTGPPIRGLCTRAARRGRGAGGGGSSGVEVIGSKLVRSGKTGCGPLKCAACQCARACCMYAQTTAAVVEAYSPRCSRTQVTWNWAKSITNRRRAQTMGTVYEASGLLTASSVAKGLFAGWPTPAASRGTALSCRTWGAIGATAGFTTGTAGAGAAGAAAASAAACSFKVELRLAINAVCEIMPSKKTARAWWRRCDRHPGVMPTWKPYGLRVGCDWVSWLRVGRV